MMSHIHGHKQECCPPFFFFCLSDFYFSSPVRLFLPGIYSSADLLFLNLDLQTNSSCHHPCQPRSHFSCCRTHRRSSYRENVISRCTNITSFMFSDVSPQWLTAARAPMLCLVSAAWPAEPVGAGVSVLGCS